MNLEREIREAVEREYDYSGEAWRAYATELLAEVDRLRATVAEYDRAHLRCLMSDISEDYWCAGWITSNELMLWRAITTDDATFGPFDGNLTERELTALKRLSEPAGGWFAWGADEDGDIGAQFVPMAEWVERYVAEVKP